ncbi:MAG: translocation/assembly module TamB domain-containing protein [Burkholderiaceae bacterium]
MSENPTPQQQPARPEPSTGRRIARYALWSIGGLLALLLLVIGAGAWLLGREATLQRIVAEAEKAMDGRLTVEGVGGSVYDHVTFRRLVFRTTTQVITAENGTLRYALAPIDRRFTVTRADVAKLTIETVGKSDEPTVEPVTLELPAAAHLDTLRLDDVHVGTIALVDGNRTTTLTDADLRARYATEGGRKHWVVERIGVVTPWGKATGHVALAAARPFAIDGELLAEGKAEDVPYRAPLRITGRLADLELVSDFTFSDPGAQTLPGHVEVRLMPFREQPVERAQLHVSGISPKRWKGTLPMTDITVDASIVPLTGALSVRAPGAQPGSNPFKANLAVTNAMPGPLDKDRIPLASLSAELSGDSASVLVTQLKANLGAAGAVEGKGSYVVADGGTPAFTGRVRNLDLRAIQTTLITSRFAGPLAVSRAAGVLHVDGDLADTGRRVRLRGEMEGDAIRIAEADVVIGGSRLAASGSVNLARDRPFDLKGDVTHLNPKDFGNFAPADVTASFKVGGTIGAAPAGRAPQVFHVDSDIRIASSRVMNRPVSGTVVGSVTGAITPTAKGSSSVKLREVAGADVALAFGANRVTAKGDFGGPRDQLLWTVDAPKLADVDPSVTGVLTGSGTIGGTLEEPSIEFKLGGDDLRYAKAAPVAVVPPAGAKPATSAPKATALSLKSFRGEGKLLAGSSGVLDVDIHIAELRDGSASKAPLVQVADARVRGTRSAHELTVTASSDRFDVSAAASGGLDAGNVWRGSVTQFASRGKVPFSLDGTTTVLASADRVEIGKAVLRFTEGRVQLDRLVSADGTIATTGTASSFPLAVIGTLSPEFARQVSTSLKFGGQWDLRVGDTIDGSVRLFRESGNVQFLTDPKFSIEPTKLEIAATVVADRVTAQVTAIGEGLGRIEGSVGTRLEKRGGAWGLSSDAPLTFTSAIDVPDLRWLARLSGRPGLDLRGHVKMAVTGKGTVGEPLLAGHASGESISIRWPDQGVNFSDGRLDVDFDGDRVVLKQATMTSGKGTLGATGELRLADRNVTGKLVVKFDKFEAVSRTDRTVVVSGTGSANFGASGIDLVADLKADRGSLQLAERRGPTISDDIVIVGREKTDEDIPARSVPVRLSVKFDMGDDFKVKGSGFEGKLGGNIAITGTGADLRAIGTVSVREGIYKAYGQELTITRGNLTFSGPIDNPALDIIAVRKNLAVEAGVQISGTALAPQAKLVSTPDVPDTEKLSWLVLGHGLAAGSKADFGLLTTAASSLLGSSDSTSLQSRLAATLGVDEIGVSGFGGDTGGLLTVGKQISEKLRVTLEQGFTKAATLVKVRYKVFNHIDLQVQTGTESAIDIFYTFSFD